MRYQHVPKAPVVRQRNPYGPVDITYFEQSLSASQQLLNEASQLIQSLEASPELMDDLMTAAQADDKEEVNEIIESIGIPTDVETTYNPSSVTFKLVADAPHSLHCCTLTIRVQWGN
ncbi:hypothetical protein [Salsuginibacillus kocurii]|uniref:hypothetical protein n=1 Tax=Salsuginibacillus kocurii TaxID=427078 RepID=UPI00037264FA|nr:hypothetical protein [Salsuginibacillus kocurii]